MILAVSLGGTLMGALISFLILLNASMGMEVRVHTVLIFFPFAAVIGCITGLVEGI
jgi:hypothetical protein